MPLNKAIEQIALWPSLKEKKLWAKSIIISISLMELCLKKRRNVYIGAKPANYEDDTKELNLMKDGRLDPIGLTFDA